MTADGSPTPVDTVHPSTISHDSALDTFETPHSPPNELATDDDAGLALEQEPLKSMEAALGALGGVTLGEGSGRNDDNKTLAALAATSSSSLPMRQVEDSQLDGDSPSFVLVASLRSEITDLTHQVTSLNTKLVSSYTRIGDLEDDLHERVGEETRARQKISALETDKSTWEQEISGGGWVERDHVQGEMQRLMAKVLEETKSRESAVEAHTKLETEIENLTSSLFTEANRMVAVERFARARAEEKMKSLEESGTVMSGLLDELQTNLRDKVESLDALEAEVGDLRRRLALAGAPEGDTGIEDVAGGANGVLFSDGNHVTAASRALANALAIPLSPQPSHISRQLSAVSLPPRLLTSVIPYQEFLGFVTYLRDLRGTVLTRPIEPTGFPHPYATAPPPVSAPMPSHSSHSHSHSHQPSSPAQLLATYLPLSSHLSQPFLKRCVEEDSDPGLRLDLAPGLGFLSRRTVGTAVVDGTLLIEPTHSGSSLPSASCALCGVGLEPWWGGEIIVATPKPNVNNTMRKVLGGGGWSISSFTGGTRKDKDKDSLAPSSPTIPSSSTPATPTGIDTPFTFQPLPHQQIHVFRVSDASTTQYAICPSYCLPRLRAVCEFWNYVRVMERGLLLEEGFKFVAGRGSVRNIAAVADGREDDDNEVEDDLDVVIVPVDVTKVDRSKEEVTVEESGVQVVEIGRKGAKVDSDSAAAVAVAPAEDRSTVTDPSAPIPVIISADTPDITLDDSTSPSSTPPSAPVDSDTPTVDGQAPLLAVADLSSASAPTSPSLNKPPIPPRSGARVSSPASAEVATQQPPRDVSTPGPVRPSRSAREGRHVALKDVSEVNGPVDSATGWEQRCWSEVVRLKESVFWSRVAGDGSALPDRS